MNTQKTRIFEITPIEGELMNGQYYWPVIAYSRTREEAEQKRQTLNSPGHFCVSPVHVETWKIKFINFV